MATEKGKGRAAVFPEAALDERLSSNPKIDRTTQRRIGDQLRAMYDDLMQQGVPDRFAALLSKLEHAPEEKER